MDLTPERLEHWAGPPDMKKGTQLLILPPAMVRDCRHNFMDQRQRFVPSRKTTLLDGNIQGTLLNI